MSKQPEPAYGYIGHIATVPSSTKRSHSQHNESRGVENKVRATYKDEYGGGSSKFTDSYKAEEFVDKSTGKLGYKEEAKYTCTEKYVDKRQGYTAEYETQLKVKKSVYPNKNGGGSGTKYSNYNNDIDYY